MKQNETCTIGLMGHGLVYQHMKLHLESRYQTIQVSEDCSIQEIAACTCIVSCSDSWSPRTLREINRRCRQAGVALLPVYTAFDVAIVGPCIVPQERGCTSCAELRKLVAATEKEERELLNGCLFGEHDLAVSQPWLTSYSLDMLGQLVAEEIASYVQKPSQLRTHRALLYIALETLDCSRHPVVPLADCPDCGGYAEDTAEAATITLQSRPKLEPWTYRTRQVVADAEQLFAQYIDARTGMIQSLATEDESSLPIAVAQFHTEFQDGENMSSGAGCTVRTRQSKVVALLEAIERYASIRPRGKRAMIQASYNQLGWQALDPTTLGLYSAEQYAQPDYCFVSYHHDLNCQWVWGYSFQRQSPILVPESCVYYGISRTREGANPAFVDNTSNGTALGSCLEEAIFHGILEVAERDAFLQTWYARLGVPQVDPRSATDPTIRAMIEHFEYHTGYTLRVFQTTLDHAIPCLWIMGIDEQNRPGWPKVHCVASADPHPEQAFAKGLRELTIALSVAPQRYQEGRTAAAEMLKNPDAVKGMPDHSLLYYQPEAFARFDFLFHAPQYTFQEAFRTSYTEPLLAHNDLRDDLNVLIEHYLTLGTDIVVVDQTAPECEADGLRCVKVLMPGMLPMTFGHPYRRTTGLPRLYEVPYRLGYADRPLTDAELNPHPHPFF